MDHEDRFEVENALEVHVTTYLAVGHHVAVLTEDHLDVEEGHRLLD